MMVTVRVASPGVWGVSPRLGLGRQPLWRGAGQSPVKKIRDFLYIWSIVTADLEAEG